MPTARPRWQFDLLARAAHAARALLFALLSLATIAGYTPLQEGESEGEVESTPIRVLFEQELPESLMQLSRTDLTRRGGRDRSIHVARVPREAVRHAGRTDAAAAHLTLRSAIAMRC